MADIVRELRLVSLPVRKLRCGPNFSLSGIFYVRIASSLLWKMLKVWVKGQAAQWKSVNVIGGKYTSYGNVLEKKTIEEEFVFGSVDVASCQHIKCSRSDNCKTCVKTR